MSDRPMLLKYLTTKMKIILCIFLLCITVSVFGQSQELNGIVGKSIEFPATVKTVGSLIYSSKVIGRVLGGELLPLTTLEYQGRVHWNSSTGLFSLSELRLKDSGVYTVEKDDGQKSVSTFSLTVWMNVSKPHVSITRNEYPCALLCSVETGTRVTLSWYREGEEKPFISLVESAPHLHLPQSVERSGIYTCEAKNSVSNETSDPLTVGAHCTTPTSFSRGTIVAIIIAVVAVLIAVVLAFLFWRLRSKFQARKLINSVDPPTYVNNKQPLSSCDEDEQASPQDGSDMSDRKK